MADQVAAPINTGSPATPTITEPIAVPGPAPEKDNRTSEDRWIEEQGGDEQAPESGKSANASRSEQNPVTEAPAGAYDDDEDDGGAQTGDETAPEAQIPSGPVVSPREKLAYAETLRRDGWTEPRIARFFDTATDDDINWVDRVTQQVRQQPEKQQQTEKPVPIAERLAPTLAALKEKFGDDLSEPLGQITGAFEKEIGGYQDTLRSVVDVFKQEMANVSARSDQLEWQLGARDLVTELPVLRNPAHNAKIQDVARSLVKNGDAKGMDMTALIRRAASTYITGLPKATQAKMNADSHRLRSQGTPTRQGVTPQRQAGASKLSPEDQWGVDNGYPIEKKR